MEYCTLGATGLRVSRTAFGVLPIQRVEMAEADRILGRAFEAGINFYDTARAYSDSEEKLGQALGSVRDRIVIATKSGATTRQGVLKDLETSLRNLRCDAVDLLQLHNPAALPDPNDPQSSYAALLEAKQKGMVRHIGITNHSRQLAAEAVASGLYESLQFPLSMISDAEDLALIDLCRRHNVGVIAMKGLCGGILTNARAAFAFLRQYENVVPIWGIQHMHELEEFLGYEAKPPALDAELLAAIERDKRDLSGNFCRACGYCLPCPVDIPIPMAARMRYCLARMPSAQFLTQEWQEKMSRIERCTRCGACASRCPYGLDTPALLQEMLGCYRQFLAEHRAQD